MRTTSDRDQALVGDALPAEAGMKAVVQRRYGPPEVLDYTDVGRPIVGDGDVLIGVRAASVHPDAFYRFLAWPNGIAMVALGCSLWQSTRTSAPAYDPTPTLRLDTASVQ